MVERHISKDILFAINFGIMEVPMAATKVLSSFTLAMRQMSHCKSVSCTLQPRGMLQIGPQFLVVIQLMHVTCRYLNNTGLMWESAEEFGALLVFAEHRYYGESRPYSGSELRHNMQYLTAEQAMADYAELLRELKSELHAEDSAVIGFGGSYGGMLAAWMRMKYPHVLAGSIASSAPIWAFPGEDPPVDPGAFAKIVTRDATPAGGASKACAGQAFSPFPVLLAKQKERPHF